MMQFGSLLQLELTLEKHYDIAKEEGLKYAYLGNVPGHPLEHTYCPECKNIVIQRYGFSIAFGIWTRTIAVRGAAILFQ